jgi:hypothetical protein
MAGGAVPPVNGGTMTGSHHHHHHQHHQQHAPSHAHHHHPAQLPPSQHGPRPMAIDHQPAGPHPVAHTHSHGPNIGPGGSGAPGGVPASSAPGSLPNGAMTNNGSSYPSSVPAQASAPSSSTSTTQQIASNYEDIWIRMGVLAEQMQDYEKAMSCFESALRHNPYSISALTKIGTLCKNRNQFQHAVEYFQRILKIDNNNGDIWGALGHCYLLMEDLQKAYHAYQQALYILPNANVSYAFCFPFDDDSLWFTRMQNYGMVLVFCMIVMAPMNMLKKHFQHLCVLIPIMKKQARFISD